MVGILYCFVVFLLLYAYCLALSAYSLRFCYFPLSVLPLVSQPPFFLSLLWKLFFLLDRSLSAVRHVYKRLDSWIVYTTCMSKV
jgi:hypothetical protein